MALRLLPLLPLLRLALAGGVGNEQLSVEVEGKKRHFRRFVPEGGAWQLWLIFGGTGDTAESFLEYTGLGTFAPEKRIAYLCFEALGSPTLFNVYRHAHPVPDKPPDVRFVQRAIEMSDVMNFVDRRHVHCAGYSNGGRFCVTLASELSDVVASVGIISALRYPKPNYAIRPVPILAMHGKADTVNPWDGHGNPEYWHMSVPEALAKWCTFNECACGHPEQRQLFPDVHSLSYRCRADAELELMIFEHGGHSWPGCANDRSEQWCGVCNQEVDANLELLNFFARHPLPLAAAASASRGEGGSALLAALGPGAGGPRWAAVAPDVAFFGSLFLLILTLCGLCHLLHCRLCGCRSNGLSPFERSDCRGLEVEEIRDGTIQRIKLPFLQGRSVSR
ncbi:unnamed protein product [Effrenium voratum]|nr:unnamed protein product [Effrenium voratum]